MRCRFTHIAFITGTMLAVSSVSFAASSPSKPSADQGARLLNRVAADAQHIETAASQLERLAKDSSSSWEQYDRQWNEIQPFVERMNINIARLEGMESSLTASQKKALDDSKAESQQIAWHSKQLGKLVDQVPANLTAPQFRNASREMVNEASKVADAAKSGA